MNPNDFTCKRCGECCKPIVILSSDDIQSIKKLGYNDDSFIDKDYLVNNRKTIKRKDGKCIFLRYNAGVSGCVIYENRPNICRLYPFFNTSTARERPNPVEQPVINQTLCIIFSFKK